MKKLPGRVGDTPLIAAGPTRTTRGRLQLHRSGEAIIKVTLARAAVDGLKAGADPMAVARAAVATLARAGVTGGSSSWTSRAAGVCVQHPANGPAWVGPDGSSGSGFD